MTKRERSRILKQLRHARRQAEAGRNYETRLRAQGRVVAYATILKRQEQR